MKSIIIHSLISLLFLLTIAYILKGKFIERVRTVEMTRTNHYDQNGMLIYYSCSDHTYLDWRYKLKLIKKEE